MSTKDDLNRALKDAMRASDNQRKSVLRSALSAIKLADVEKGSELDEPETLAVLQKEVKARHEAIADAEKANRPETVQEQQAEIAILEEYLPRPLSEEELAKLVEEVVKQVGASSPADMGKVMGAIMPRVRGRADGGKVNQVVRQRLQNI